MYEESMITFVNAKINIGLNVMSRRSDGYHNLQSIFYPIGKYNGKPENPAPFCDIMEVRGAQQFDLELSGNNLLIDKKDNLVWKAMMLFSQRYKSKIGEDMQPVIVSLEKYIPSQAGLGGGSADASFALCKLNELTNAPFNYEELCEMAATLGADCPFFIYNKPAFVEGIGEKITEIPDVLKGYWAAIVKPNVAMSTAQAFSMIQTSGRSIDFSKLIRKPVETWSEYFENDFESPFFNLFPSTKSIKEQLYNSGALYASLSGSGSAFYGIFASAQDAQKALNAQSDDCFKTLCLL